MTKLRTALCFTMMDKFSRLSILLWITFFLIVKCHSMDNEDASESGEDVLDEEDVSDDEIELTEKAIRKLMQKKVIIKGSSKSITLRAIYGKTPLITDFKADTEFLHYLRRYKSKVPVLDIYKIKPITNAFVVPLHNIDYKSSEHEKFISIIGDPQTGKTATLRGFESYLRKNFPSDIIIYMDVKETDVSTRRELTIRSLIDSTIKRPFVKFVENVANVNPAKIRLLIDSVDEKPGPPNNRQKIINLIFELVHVKIQVITTSCAELEPELTTQRIEPQKFKIPSTVPISDLKKFTVELWKRQAVVDKIGHINEADLGDYFDMLYMAIQETPLPRTIGMMRRIADAVSTPEDPLPFKDVFAYAKIPKKTRKMRHNMLNKILHKMPSLKMDLYSKYLYKYWSKSYIYGLAGLTIMTELQPQLFALVVPFLEGLEPVLSAYGEGGMRLTRIMPGSVEFIHPEIQYYYVAGFFTSLLVDPSPLFAVFNELFLSPQFTSVLEFINSEPRYLKKPNMVRVIGHIINNKNLVKQIMDNLLQNRFDNTLSHFLEALDIQSIKDYLSDRSVILRTEKKYSFGMQTEANNGRQLADKITYIPRKSPLTFQGVREDMIINLEMPETEKILLEKSYTFDPDLLLRFHARHSSAEQLISFLDAHVGHDFSVDVLNRALFESVDTLGIESLPIVKILVQRRATPETIKIAGRTLAHVAAQWASRELMETLHEQYKVSLVDNQLDHSGRSILFTALDANPFNTYTRRGFWEMMQYLVTEGDLTANRDFIRNELNKPIVQFADCPRPFLTLLAGGTQLDLENVVSEFQAYHAIDGMDVSSDVLAIRRRVVLRECFKNYRDQQSTRRLMDLPNREITISEVLLRYRGSAPMNFIEKDLFQDTATQMIWREAKNYNDLQKQRVFRAFAQTVNDQELMDTAGSLYGRLAEIHKMPGNDLFLNYVRDIFTHYKWENDQRIRHPLLIRPITTVEQLIVATEKDLTFNRMYQVNELTINHPDNQCYFFFQ